MSYVLLDKEKYNNIVNRIILERMNLKVDDFHKGKIDKYDPKYSIVSRFILLSKDPKKNAHTLKYLAEQIFLGDIDFWTYNSLRCESKEEIIALLIKSTLSSGSYICISYLCANPIIDDELIDEMIYVSNDLFDWDNYNENNIKSITNFVKRHINENDVKIEYDKDFKREFKFDKKNERKILSYQKGYRGRVDWFAIAKNGLLDRLSKEYQEAAKNSKLRAIYDLYNGTEENW